MAPRFSFTANTKALASSQWISAIKAAFVSIEAEAALASDVTTAGASLAAHIASSPATHAAGSITDTLLGNRTVAQATAAADTANLAALLGGLANRILAITGKADWKTTPATTLEAVNTHYTASGSHNRYFGNGNPEGVVTAPAGSAYYRQDAVLPSDVAWVKLSGAGNTGWRKVGMQPSVQRGTITLSFDQVTATATIPALADLTKAELRLLGVSSDAVSDSGETERQLAVRLELTNATTITATRQANTDNTGQTTVASWELTVWS